jgi:hypothetical protein
MGAGMGGDAVMYDNGDYEATAPNGDTVRLHLSHFHGLVVTAGRTYVGGERREVSAYLGDPAPVLAWLKREMGDPA